MPPPLVLALALLSLSAAVVAGLSQVSSGGRARVSGARRGVVSGAPAMAKRPPPPPAKAAPEAASARGVEPKYLYALGVFLLACLGNKQFMHGGLFPSM